MVVSLSLQALSAKLSQRSAPWEWSSFHRSQRQRPTDFSRLWIGPIIWEQEQDLGLQSVFFYPATTATPWNSWRGFQSSPPCMHLTSITVNSSYTCISMGEKSQSRGITGSKKRNPVERLGTAKDPTPLNKSISPFNQLASACWPVMQEAL